MRNKNNFYCVKNPRNNVKSSNVKSLQKYEHFGETIRYLTIDELQQFFESIDNYFHKLMFRVIYELGCRVGEFVRIQIKHLNFIRSTVFFPAENAKTKHPRTSCLPKGLMNEVRSMLKQKRIISKRSEKVRRPDVYLFHPGKRYHQQYTENRIRQIFHYYIEQARLQRIYAKDSNGRKLKMFTVHSLRHSPIMHYTVDRKVALPIIQKQVGHKSLKTISIYLRPSTEKMADAYEKAVLES